MEGFTPGDPELHRELEQMLKSWLEHHRYSPTVGRWDWERGSFSVVLGGDVVAWVTGESIEDAVVGCDWSFIKHTVAEGIRDWDARRRTRLPFEDEDTGARYEIVPVAMNVLDLPGHPGEREYQVSNLTTGEGPVTVWAPELPTEPKSNHLGPIVEKAKEHFMGD